MTVYQTTGTLTGTIERENVGMAQEFLTNDPKMAEYVADHAKLEGVLEWIEWNLHADGHAYHITAVTTRDLTDEELKRLADAVSGQNSDGLGESFEQQPYCEMYEEGEDEYEDDYAGMISFDWKTNDSVFTKV